MDQRHEDKYRGLNEKFGVAWTEDTPKLVGVTLQELAKLFKEDEHLNNISLRLWDQLADHFLVVTPRSGLSQSDAVCMQKQAARDLVINYMRTLEKSVLFAEHYGAGWRMGW